MFKEEKYYVVGIQLNQLMFAPAERIFYLKKIGSEGENISYKFTDNLDDVLEEDKHKRAFLAGRLLKDVNADRLCNDFDGCFSMIYGKDPNLAETLMTIEEEELVDKMKIYEISQKKIAYLETAIAFVGQKGYRNQIHTTKQQINP